MLYQYHGNDMEVLRKCACTLLGAAPSAPLVAERVMVPNIGMAKWLRAGIAAHSGIAANLRMESPPRSSTVSRARCPAKCATRRRARVDQGATGAAHHARTAVAASPARFRGGGALSGRQRSPAPPPRADRGWRNSSTATCLSRHKWMLAWESDTATAEPALAGNAWQALSGSGGATARGAARSTARRRRLRQLIDGLGGRRALPVALTGRIIGFGLGSLAPLFVEALHALANRTDVHLFQFNPSNTYWYDTKASAPLHAGVWKNRNVPHSARAAIRCSMRGGAAAARGCNCSHVMSPT